MVEDQAEFIEFLSNPATHGLEGSEIRRVDTHGAAIFLVGERAYKLKRAVKFPYLDFSTVERRRQTCENEVRINRRTAPAIYRGVVAITRTPEGGLQLGGDGQVVDWLVEMRRFDEESLFVRLAESGLLDRFAMEDLADAIARFHRDAEPHPEAGGAQAMAAIIDNNAESFADYIPEPFGAEAVAALTKASHKALGACRDLIDQRRDAGFVRHCHGDLHLRNIFLHDGQATLFDAIEFDDTLARIDVLYDLAFLIMDLDYRGLRPLASIVFNRYLDDTGDAGGLAAMPLFLSLRAAIRGHIDAAAARTQGEAARAQAFIAGARRHFDMAVDYLQPSPQRLIAIGGLSGSGKSRMARELAPLLDRAPGARIVRTDTTRKRLAGVSFESRLGAQGYTPEMTARTYEAVFTECRAVLQSGRSVIADAVFGDPDERFAIRRVAEECGVPFNGLWLEADSEEMRRRVVSRRRNASDATPWVVRMQLEFDVGTIDWDRIDTIGARAESVAQAKAKLGLAGFNG